MLSAEDFACLQIQASIFTPALNFHTGRVVGVALSGWPDYFSKIQFAGDLPATFPADVPRVVLQSQDSRYSLRAGPARLDILWVTANPGEQVDMRAFLNLCCDVFERYAETFNGSVGRIAGVVTKIANDPDPAATLSRHFCKDGWVHEGAVMGSIAEFELNTATHYRLNSFSVNSWLKSKSAILSKSGPPHLQQAGRPVVLVEVDVNTRDDFSTAAFQSAQVREFYALLPGKFEQRMERFFPRGPR